MMYNNVLIRRWTAFAEARRLEHQRAGHVHTSASLDPGTTIGGYRGVTTPDEPISCTWCVIRTSRGCRAASRTAPAQQQLLSTTFEQFELEIRRHLARMLAGGGFDPAGRHRRPHRESVAVRVLPTPTTRSAIRTLRPKSGRTSIGRQRFGRIDDRQLRTRAPAAFTNQAIDEAHRAVEELFVAEGLA